MDKDTKIESKQKVKAKLTALETPGQTTSKNAENEIRLDIDKLNESTFKDMIRHYDAKLSSPTEHIVTALITALSGTIGKRFYLEFGHLRYYLNVWAVIIGKSSTSFKSTCIKEVLKDINKIGYEIYKRYKSSLDVYNIESKDNKNAKKPFREYLKFPDDLTVEIFLDSLANQQRGIMSYNELSQLLKHFQKGYGGDFKELLTNLYDVIPTYEVKRIGRETELIERPYISLLGASTIDWFRDGIKESDISAGFLARFLYAIRNVNDKPIKSIHDLNAYEYEMQDSYFNTETVYRRLYNLQRDEVIRLDKDAENIHREYESMIFRKSNSQRTSDNESSYLARLNTYSVKIAGIIALTNDHNKVTKEDMQDSLTLCAYYEKNIRQLLDIELQANRTVREENRLIELIKMHGETKNGEIMITRRILQQKAKRPVREFNDNVTSLIEKGILTENETRQDGKKAGMIYILNVSNVS